MMHALKRFITLAAAAALLTCGAGTSLASVLTLEMSGATNGATLNSSPIANGTAWSLSATFDTQNNFIPLGPGTSLVFPVSLTAVIGTTSYIIDPTSARLLIQDATNPTVNGYYLPAIAANGTTTSLVPGFTGSSPAGWDAHNPTPTTFQDHIGFMTSSITLPTSAGDLILSVDTVAGGSTAGISAATAVPEPSTYALLCISLGAVGFARKRMMKGEA